MRNSSTVFDWKLKSEITKISRIAAASGCAHKIIFKSYLCRTVEEVCETLRHFWGAPGMGVN